MHYDTMESELGPILFACDDTGLTRVHFTDSGKPLAMDESWRRTGRDPLLKETRRQLEAYFAGKLRQFSLPLSMDGSEFQIRVWKALATIPYGATWSYKELATAVGNPAACRAVGHANGKNKIVIIVPCHRVIGSGGDLVGFASGLVRKRYLISLEQSYTEIGSFGDEPDAPQ